MLVASFAEEYCITMCLFDGLIDFYTILSYPVLYTVI